MILKKVLSVVIKQCSVCLNVLKSQCSKSAGIVDGKKPLSNATMDAHVILKNALSVVIHNVLYA